MYQSSPGAVMYRRASGWTVLALTVAASAAWGQNPGFTPPAPQLALPPLMYVRLAGPAGMKITIYRGLASGDTVAAPAVVGLRPGFAYSFALSDIPDHPKEIFCPTLEVRGSLVLDGKLRNADFPATIQFHKDDFLAAKNGLVKKVVVLERPDQAIPQATKPEAPIELNLTGNRDLGAAALERGQMLAMLLLGEKQMSTQELAARGLPGTVLMPGEKVLPAPRHRPWVPFACYQMFDPLLGPVPSSELMAICDGGDCNLPAGFDRFGKLRGLDPSDTVAEYEDSKGRKRLAVSNRVCLCVPRFVLLRTETQLGNQVALVGTHGMQGLKGFARFESRQPLQENTNLTMLDSMANRQKASGNVTQYGTAITGKVEGLEIKSSMAVTQLVDGQCLVPTLAEPMDRPLLIIKWPDKCGGLVGEVITFTLKYTNQGGRPVNNLVLSDNLAPRFEYVPGSTKTDRDASFTIQPNDVGSSILRWEFSGQLLPRESGIVTFQVRIR